MANDKKHWSSARFKEVEDDIAEMFRKFQAKLDEFDELQERLEV